MNSHFKLILPDTGRDIYTPCQSQRWGYRYGPSIMVEGNVCHAWFASPGDGCEADWFTYRRSEDHGKTWSDERVVMKPVADSMDWFSVCDPAVIKYGDWYYMGYTSTIFANGGGVCNNAFVGRSKTPDGLFERWTGNGWGETRETADGTLHWMGKPDPIIYFDEDWHNWGAGEVSFVIKDDLLYIYYSWSSKRSDGTPISETRVATADITNENWPATITPRGTAIVHPGGANDSYDVVYCEDLNKFVALSTDLRFSENSLLAVCESDDGLRFTRVNQIKANVGWMCHNCGISGDAQHHIKQGDTLLLAYAYGNQWGCWSTRLHDYTFTAMDEDFYDESHLSNQHHEIIKSPDPAEYKTTLVYLGDHHLLRVKKGESKIIPITIGNIAYDMIRTPGNITYSNYDPSIIEIRDDRAYGLSEGYTYLLAERDGCACECLIFVSEEEPMGWQDWKPYPEKAVTSFVPMIPSYRASLKEKDMKQIRGMATYADGTRFEVCGDDGVTYDNHAPELLDIRENGNVIPKGTTGTGTITVSCGGHSFDVTFTVSE